MVAAVSERQPPRLPAGKGGGGGGGGAGVDLPMRMCGRGERGASSLWCVYLIVSSRISRTYIGVTNNFPRRLKQHNGELKGGAKASRAGRPWICACIVQGFKDKYGAFRLEARWKEASRSSPRKNGKDENAQNRLLLHREAALSRVKDSLGGCHLRVDWMAGPSQQHGSSPS
ncbi:unnamed protein product [Spirodela intermedia]|uniref:GIY-YIG domain-containing protein n=1 Tax=Spirodela intermedia TaxID=51605 RepID=A0A7I8IX15_SPIIN|nr:unnamed protein product [Spirodela intermedia]CAA6662135.1 unnamed protein product [Spirodela intermedia]